MKNYIYQIEKFLRGQMSQQEEDMFKKSLTTDSHLHSYAFIMALIEGTKISV